ncbi:prolyl oligopeptidase family serine peptidase [Sporosarcina siberiensis]|uniref:Prolyl oligopeptidase family serine peptidase n=1 Tax=Sporosarcina siberiensis TaxID=1365606 RepID=A0ABW4SKJ2_9BACL
MIPLILKEELWNGIPILHIVEEQYDVQEVPVMIFLHGFSSAKEHNLHYAYNLARQGIRVILPDAHLHGVRDENLDEVQLGLRFWEVILTSIEEVGILKKELLKRKLIVSKKIAVGGTSMGGITTLGCLTTYEWISSALVMMGTPGYEKLARAQIGHFERGGFELPISADERKKLFANLAYFDLTKQPKKLNQRPLYFWHGKNDTVVPFEPTYHFYKAMKKEYYDVPERIVFDADEIAGHSVSREGLLKATSWVASQLND